MHEYHEILLVCYFICLFFNVFLIKFYKYYYVYELFCFYVGFLWLANQRECKINTIELEKSTRPTKKRKIKPTEIDWCSEYW